MNTCTASRLADALGRTRQWAYAALADVPTTGTKAVGGQTARAWRLADLPPSLCSALAAVAQRRNISVEQLLSDPPRPWQPPKAFDTLPETIQRNAEQWRDALALPLARRNELREDDWKALARQQCRRVFGREIPDKTWLAPLDIAVNRDNGFEQWARVDLYVSEAVYAVSPALPRAALELRGLHRELNEVVATLENKLRPTLDDRAFILDAAFVHFEKLCQEHAGCREQKEIKRSLVGFLHSALPSLARTEVALRRLFDRKLTAWRIGGRTVSAIADHRPLKSGRDGATLCPECRSKVIGAAVSLDGNKRQAWRRLHQAGQLCPACESAWTFNARRNKSYLPASVDRDISPDVTSALPHRRGPKFSRLAGPYIPRDWNDTAPGDYFSADDVTWNNYYWFTDDAGQKQIARGECLLMTDLRTGYPLGFLMIAGKYNSQHVRTLLLRVHDLETVFHGVTETAGGLPHTGCYFERGVWAARLIEGPRWRGCEWNPWRETEMGLREHGLNLDVRHATTPRAKPIEGLLRILQERMRSELGFVGFNERMDGREVMQDFLARTRRGQEEPSSELPSMEQWRGRVAAILQEFADDPQNGKMLPGVSPAEAWWNGIGGKPGIADRPLRHLADESRFLLATHKRPVDVTPQGIRFRIGKREFVYWGETLAPHVNRRVLAFFNLECPELLVCSDLERQSYFAVKAVSAPAMTASPERLAELNDQRAAFTKPARMLFGSLPKPLAATITRDTEHDAPTRELGAFVNEATAQHREEKQADARKLRNVRQLAGALGESYMPRKPRHLKE